MISAAEANDLDRVVRTDFSPQPSGDTSQPRGLAPLPHKRRKRRLFFVAAIFLIATVVWGMKTTLFSKRAANLVTAQVSIGDIEQTVLATGTLKPVKLVAVGAQVSGRVVSLKVSLGQKIKAGELIAEIDSVTQQNILRTNEAALQNTRAQRAEKEATLALAEANLSRQQITLAQRASSRADYDTAETNVKITRAQIAQLDAQIIEAEVAIETARVNLGYTRITAPIDGTVLSIVTLEGQTMNAVQSAPTVVVLGQVETMTIRAEISEADVVRVSPGQNVYFTILGDPVRRYYANLESIEPAPESIKTDSSFTSTTTSSSNSSSSSTSSAIYYNGIFKVPNVGGDLRTYMTAEVHILLGEVRNVLTIPAAALSEIRPDGTATVKVVEPSGTVTTKLVAIGLNNKIMAEVRDGLSKDERVVIGSTGGETSAKASIGPPPRGL